MIENIIQNSMDKPNDFVFGFADLNGLIGDSSLRFGIVIGKRLDDHIIDAIEEGPTFDYLTHYKAVNKELSEQIHSIGKQIVDIGFSCKIIEPTISTTETLDKDYQISLRTPVSHKMIATRSGLGWIGKTDLFISKKFGPRLRLASLLTDYPLPISKPPIDKSKCGHCDKCVISCPANAATGQLWDIHTDRDYFFDAHKCREMCRNLTQTRLNMDLTICGICVSVCPIGKLNSQRRKSLIL